LEWKFAVDQGSIIRPDDTADDSKVWTVRRGEGSQVRSHIKVRPPQSEMRDEFVPSFAAPASLPASDDPWDTGSSAAPTDPESSVVPEVENEWQLHALPATFQIDDEFELVIQNTTNNSKSRR
jgi:hypothetical protein